MKYAASLLLTLLFILNSAIAQDNFPSYDELMEIHKEHKVAAIQDMYSTINDIKPLILNMKIEDGWKVKKEGESLEGRPIYSLTYGSGPTNVLLWSQMHGDEPTATMTIMDMLKSYQDGQEEINEIWNYLGEKLTIKFIPMLNPDGAEQFKRRNAAHIDLNRDAIHLSNPESRILKDVRDEFEPKFGFNLHDQSVYYRAGREGDQVAIAFLAPAYNYDKDINSVRRDAMRLISVMADSLAPIIPNRVAKYSDAFEPRAFGDNIQKWGTSTILIESGGYPGDEQKQYLRKLHYAMLFKALTSIASESYENTTKAGYEALPFNQSRMRSLLIENVVHTIEGQEVPMDIAYKGELEKTTAGIRYTNNRIIDIGDLSIYSGLKSFDGQGMQIVTGKASSLDKSPNEMTENDYLDLLKEGVHSIIVEEVPDDRDFYPMDFVDSQAYRKYRTGNANVDIKPGTDPTYFLGSEDNLKYLVKNGQVLKLKVVARRMASINWNEN